VVGTAWPYYYKQLYVIVEMPLPSSTVLVVSTIMASAYPVMASASPVLVLSVPVSVALPSSPVLPEVAITNAIIPGMMMAIIRGQMMEEPRYPVPFNEAPRAVIASRPVPAALEGTIPVVMIKDNIHARVRHCVCISPRYHHHFRGRLKRIGREIHSYIYRHSGKAFRRPREPQAEHRESKNKYDTRHLLHVESSFSKKINHFLLENKTTTYSPAILIIRHI
jgi:hypothetical protein